MSSYPSGLAPLDEIPVETRVKLSGSLFHPNLETKIVGHKVWDRNPTQVTDVEVEYPGERVAIFRVQDITVVR